MLYKSADIKIMELEKFEIKYKNFIVHYKTRSFTWDSIVVNEILDEYSKCLELSIDGLPIIDLGAHIGGFSKLASTIYPNSKIYAYEPDIQSYNLLQENMVGINNFISYNKAVSGEETVGFLWKKLNTNSKATRAGYSDPAMYEVLWDTEKNKEDGVVVECVPINSIFNSLKEVGLIKIDCEGSELTFLKYLSQENKNKIKYIVGEVHPSEKIIQNCDSKHSDGEIIRDFFKGFKIIVKARTFFGWK